MDLRQLRYFVAVAEHGGVRKASAGLYVAQPAISHALRQLERQLGVELLHRTSRGVRPTEAGEELLVHARDILARAGEAQDAMRTYATRPATTRPKPVIRRPTGVPA